LAPEPAARKRELRARLLAARRALPEPARREAARRVGEVLTGLLAAYAGRTIAGYVPMATEPGGPDLPDLLAAAVGESGRVLLPVLREDLDLAWAVAGAAGAPLAPAAIREAALLVVPAVAVDYQGVRLGRGGGSYDRALARVAPGAEVVAVLHDGELSERPLPAEPHDRRVTAAILPGPGLVRLNSTGPIMNLGS